MSRKGKSLDEYNFNWIHHEHETHPTWTYARIAKKVGWSKDTVSRSCRCSTYQEYIKLKDTLNTKMPKQVQKKKTDNQRPINDTSPKTAVVSFDQLEALAKDVDGIYVDVQIIRTYMGLVLEAIKELLSVWKEG